MTLTFEQLQNKHKGATPRKTSLTFQELKEQTGIQEQRIPKEVADEFDISAEETGATFPAEAGDKPLEAGAKAVGNVPSSFFNVVKGIGSALASPIETTKGIGNVIKGGIETSGEAVGRAIGTRTDKEDVVDTEAEATFDAFTDALKRRFGSLEALQRTATNDPFGFGSDIAGIVTGGAGLVRRSGQVAKLSTLPKGIRTSVSNRLRTSAAGQIEDALAPTKQVRKVQAERVAPKLAERKFKGKTLDSLAKRASENLDAAAQRLDEKIATIPEDTMVDLKPVLDDIEATKAQFFVDGVPIEPNAIRAANDIQDTILEITKIYGNESVPFASVRRVRQIWDEAISKTNGFQKNLNDLDQLEIKKQAANSIREQLAKTRPDINELNAEFSLWKTAEEILQDTLVRKTGQKASLGSRLFTAAGAGGGFALGGVESAFIVGTVARKMQQLFDSAAWKTTSAATKTRLAEALAEGNTTRVNEIIGTVLGEKAVSLTQENDQE